MQVNSGANGTEAAKKPGQPISGECAVCLKHLEPSAGGTVRCAGCGIIAELDCITPILRPTSDSLSAPWFCPPCADLTRSLASAPACGVCKPVPKVQCAGCGFHGGFLYPLHELYNGVLKSSSLWVHPFCALFIKEIKKNKEETAFVLAKNDAKKSKKAKHNGKKPEPQNGKTREQVCAFCQRTFGYKKQCTRCRKNAVHVFCAYRRNAIKLQGGQLVATPDGTKLCAMTILCLTCLQRSLAKNGGKSPEQSEEVSGDQSNNAGSERTLRKSVRLEEKAKKTPEAGSSPLQPAKEDTAPKDTVDQHKQKKHVQQRVIGKLRCNFHPKSPSILLALIETIVEADALHVLIKEYSALPISLSAVDLHV